MVWVEQTLPCIENGRRDNKSIYLENIGYTTAESLENAYPYRDKIDIIASGGIRNPLDVVKCLALGAKQLVFLKSS